MSDALPILNTAQDCARLAKRLGAGPVVALWATGQPRSTVDVMLRSENCSNNGNSRLFCCCVKVRFRIFLDYFLK